MDGKKWEDLCFKLPITKFNEASKYRRRRRRSVATTLPSREVLMTSENRTAREEDTFFGHAFDDFDNAFNEDFFNEVSSPHVVDWDPSIELPVETYCSMVNRYDYNYYL